MGPPQPPKAHQFLGNKAWKAAIAFSRTCTACSSGKRDALVRPENEGVHWKTRRIGTMNGGVQGSDGYRRGVGDHTPPTPLGTNGQWLMVRRQSNRLAHVLHGYKKMRTETYNAM